MTASKSSNNKNLFENLDSCEAMDLDFFCLNLMFLRAKPERQRGFERSFSTLNTIPSKECIVVFVVLYHSYHMMGLRLKVLRKAFLVAGCQVIAYSVPRFSLLYPAWALNTKQRELYSRVFIVKDKK